MLESENLKPSLLKQFCFLLLSCGITFGLIGIIYLKFTSSQPQSMEEIPSDHPLVMEDGDPYIRALMRTITYSEANDPHPYNVIYRGEHIVDLSQHPEKCVPIPNSELCSTAAGRYQFLNFTWYEKAEKYHPNPTGMLWWKSYSFEPKYQDIVAHNWLNDTNAWGFDIAQRLKNKEENDVFCDLSATWTSLPCGDEINVNTGKLLTEIYPQRLKEECAKQPDQCSELDQPG